MKFKIKAEAIHRVSTRWGEINTQDIEAKRFTSKCALDSLSLLMGIEPNDLELTSDDGGWNPYPELRPTEAEKNRLFILTDDLGTLAIAKWTGTGWDEQHENTIAFFPAPEPFKREEADMHPDAIAARRYMANSNGR